MESSTVVSCNREYNLDAVDSCVDQHANFAVEWLSGIKAKEAVELAKAISSAIGTGFLNDIHAVAAAGAVASSATSSLKKGQRKSDVGETEDLDKQQLVTKNQKMAGEGIVSTAALLAPYVFFAGAFLTTAVLISTAQWLVAGGVSYLVLNKAFNFAQFEHNKGRCQKVCKVSKKGDNNYSLLAKVSAHHFGSTVKSLIHERAEEKSQFATVRDTLTEQEKKLFPDEMFPTENEGLNAQLLIKRFSESASPILEAYVHSGAHCLMGCPDTNTISDFTCEFIKEMEMNIANLLYFAQVLSISHNNFISLDSTKNSVLGKFLKRTRSSESKTITKKARRLMRMEAGEKYGTAEENKCVLSFKEESQRKIMQKKIGLLIAFQNALEHKVKNKEELELKADYDPKSCTDCAQNPTVDVASLHKSCKGNIDKLGGESKQSSKKEAIKQFLRATRSTTFAKKQEYYGYCLSRK